MAITGNFRDKTPAGMAPSPGPDARRVEEHLRRLADGTSDVVIAIEAGDQIGLVSGPAQAVFRQSPERLRSLRLLDLVRPDDRTPVAQFLAVCREQPRARRRVEFRLARDPNRWCEMEIMNSRRDDPNLQGLVFKVCDITDRKQTQAALLERSDTLRTLTEASPLAIVVEDLDGKVQMWNPAAERVFGWTVGETIGRSLPFLLEDNKSDHHHLYDRVLQGEAFTALEAQRRRKDGAILSVTIWTAPLRDAAGNISGILQIIGDITERKQLEAQLRQVQKMEGIGRLAGGIAHDFNNLLTAILGYTDMVSRHLPGSEPQPDAAEPDWQRVQDGVQEIRRAAERAATLTQGLLAFSRSQVLQPTVVDMNAIVTGMEALALRLVGENIDVATFLDPTLAQVKADVSQLEQVIMNLVVNAKDAMPDGGKLTIETANVELDETYAHSRVAVIPGPYVRLAVSDNGCGMDADTRLRVFEPFFTTKERGKGTGLGLSTVYGIVKQSGGYVWAYSEVGHGSTFKVYLPRVQAPPVAKTEAPPVEPAPRGRESVLLVEDEEMVRTLVRQVLTWHGYHVLEARSGEEALKILERGDPIDLLLTDVIMPGMSAIDMVKIVAAKRPDLKIIYMSGYTDHAIVRNGLLAGNVPFLQKPFAPDRLAHKVREVLNSRS